MTEQRGADKPELQALVQVKERMSFLYLEHCVINRADSAITVTDARGTVHVPAASIGVILLGPGTKLTHRAVELIGDCGAMILWVGEHGVRYYAHGRSLTHSASLLIQQAMLVSNVRSRVAVARKMYQMRFPNEDVSALSMQQLRGREGARIRGVYRRLAKETGVHWNGREYDPEDFSSGDAVNMALSAANACLYGIAHSTIAALGCSPGLGFVHTGHERSFVYDIADLYKAETAIPTAFRLAAENPADLPGAVRREMRNVIFEGQLLERIVRDIRSLLSKKEVAEDEVSVDVIYLWDEKCGCVPAGVSYGKAASAMEDSLKTGYGSLIDA